jgi:hypothetical protein
VIAQCQIAKGTISGCASPLPLIRGRIALAHSPKGAYGGCPAPPPRAHHSLEGGWSHGCQGPLGGSPSPKMRGNAATLGAVPCPVSSEITDRQDGAAHGRARGPAAVAAGDRPPRREVADVTRAEYRSPARRGWANGGGKRYRSSDTAPSAAEPVSTCISDSTSHRPSRRPGCPWAIR